MAFDINRDIWINKPVEDVFAYLDNPHNQPEFTPSLAKISDVERLDNGGTRSRFTYKMVGVPLEGTVEATAYEKPHHIKFSMDGSLSGSIEWRLEEEAGGTRFYYTATYELPSKLIETAASPIIKAYNARELDATLQNLKDRVEHMASVTGSSPSEGTEPPSAGDDDGQSSRDTAA
jgi:uncharacterized protein YndB with AHSA1/START domain